MNTKISVVIVMVIMLFICSQGNIVNAETVKIDTNRFKTVVIEKGKSAKLCNLSMKKIKWKSTNKKVATVNKKGLVKAKKIGKAKITLKDQYGKRKTINVQVKKKLKKATNKNVTVKVVEGNKDYVKLELNNKSDQCIFVAYPYYLIVKNGEKKEYVSKKEILNSRRPPISLAPGSKVRIGVSLTNYNMIEGLTYKIECEVFINLQEIGIANYEITTTFCYK